MSYRKRGLFRKDTLDNEKDLAVSMVNTAKSFSE